MSRISAPALPQSSVAGALIRIRTALESVPYALLALPLRFAIATVFWNSGTTKLDNWDTTLALFRDEYRLPVIPPEIAAYMSASIELSTPFLLVFGLFTRGAALVLLGLTTVIEVFVYPQAWPTHIQWAAMLLVLLCRGAGTFSLDELIYRLLNPDARAGSQR
jgi:putative oxidoreductase